MRHTTPAVALIALVLVGCGSSTSGTTAPPTSTAGPQASTPVSVPAACETVTPTAPASPKSYTAAPKAPIAADGAKIVMVTSCGRMTFVLDTKLGGVVADSVAGLVADHFYDGLTFHRVIQGFVLQGGDPQGTGGGGPGYSVVQAPPADYHYKLGDLAMAKTQAEKDGAAGSQFFVISGTQGEGLPPQYAVLAHSSDAETLATIARIDALGTGAGGGDAPSQSVTIVSATLTR